MAHGPKANHPMHVRFTINGKPVALQVAPWETALHAIRVHLELKGTKEGCAIGECGACTIVVDGKAVNACLMLAPQLEGREVVTIEGLENPTGPHVIQEAFLDMHAVQCGFCTPGLVMSTYALLHKNPSPTRDEIVEALSGNLCRCTGYEQIIMAVQETVRRLSQGKG